MAKIWANAILRGSKTLSEIKDPTRKSEVVAELKARLDAGTITEEQYKAAMGENE